MLLLLFRSSGLPPPVVDENDGSNPWLYAKAQRKKRAKAQQERQDKAQLKTQAKTLLLQESLVVNAKHRLSPVTSWGLASVLPVVSFEAVGELPKSEMVSVLAVHGVVSFALNFAFPSSQSSASLRKVNSMEMMDDMDALSAKMARLELSYTRMEEQMRDLQDMVDLYGVLVGTT